MNLPLAIAWWAKAVEEKTCDDQLPHCTWRTNVGNGWKGRIACAYEGTVNVKIMVRGPEDRRVEHIADIPGEDQLPQAIGVAMEMYRKFYPDAPPYRQTIEIDPISWKTPEFRIAPQGSEPARNR